MMERQMLRMEGEKYGKSSWSDIKGFNIASHRKEIYMIALFHAQIPKKDPFES